MYVLLCLFRPNSCLTPFCCLLAYLSFLPASSAHHLSTYSPLNLLPHPLLCMRHCPYSKFLFDPSFAAFCLPIGHFYLPHQLITLCYLSIQPILYPLRNHFPNQHHSHRQHSSRCRQKPQ
uniref:Secreted protein n=1 Tax=Cacopsylla melanoneura TaxID=428564 RepID=A0A8D9B5D8_9HEMI